MGVKACPVCYEIAETGEHCPACMAKGEHFLLQTAEELETMAYWLGRDGMTRAHELQAAARKVKAAMPKAGDTIKVTWPNGLFERFYWVRSVSHNGQILYCTDITGAILRIETTGDLKIEKVQP